MMIGGFRLGEDMLIGDWGVEWKVNKSWNE